jgi:hypothetical protein
MRTKAQNLFDDSSGDRFAMREKMQKLRTDSNKKIEGILTEKQVIKFKQHIEEERKKREKRRRF